MQTLKPSTRFARIQRLPPYVFNIVNEIKTQARARGEDIIDFGMGNPDQPPPRHITDKLIEASQRQDTHRYSQSRGIPRLRKALADWYARKFSVTLDPQQEVIATIGSKEGLAHLALATTGPGDTVIVPGPAYPIHPYGFVIAGADILHLALHPKEDFFDTLKKTIENAWPRPKMLLLNFPANPTADCIDLAFFEEAVAIAGHYGMWIVNDLAYAEICFDGYRPPSLLQVKGAKKLAVEFYSLSKSYNMPGWRVGFMAGNADLVAALGRIKSYLDYGTFTPIQIAAIAALEGPDSHVEQIRDNYQRRRDVLCDGLNALGWPVSKPAATMFVWARIPNHFPTTDSLELAKQLLQQAKVAVSPGIGFGHYGEQHVRFSLIENPHRSRQALRNIRDFLRH